MVLFDNGTQNIVDARDLKAAVRSRKWTKKQLRVACNERVKMYYEKELYYGTIIATDPKQLKQFEEQYIKSFQPNPSLSVVTKVIEGNEQVSSAEIVIENGEEGKNSSDKAVILH